MRGRSSRRLTGVIAVIALLIVAGGAVAAVPYKNRFYTGSTSQGGKVRLKVSPGGKWLGRFNFGKARDPV